MLNSLAAIYGVGVVATDFESIATVTVGAGGAASIDFTSIASTYKHLQIRYIGRNNNSTSGTDNINLRVNGDSGTNYTYHVLYGTGSSAAAGAATSQTSARVGQLALNGSLSNTFAGGVIDILDYSNTNNNKTIRTLSGVDFNGSGVIALESSVWLSTNAITSISITSPSGFNWAQYSHFALYGIKG